MLLIYVILIRRFRVNYRNPRVFASLRYYLRIFLDVVLVTEVFEENF